MDENEFYKRKGTPARFRGVVTPRRKKRRQEYGLNVGKDGGNPQYKKNVL